MGGGYLGVDVFFVISGFVIGLILLQEIEESNHIKFSNFMGRRLFRLLPALALVTIVVILVSNVWFTSELLHKTVNSTAAASIFGLSNYVIAYISGGYFGAAPNLNPLLHTWSLSAEWQFYLLVPLIFMAIGRLGLRGWRRTRAIGASFVLFGLASFAINFIDLPAIFDGRIELNGYYSSVGRFWEFSAGVLAALLGRRIHLSRFLSDAAGLLGIGAIFSSFFLIDGGTQTPGISTLVPVAGAVLLILGGYNPGAISTRVLSVRPLTRIGDLSYSVYLWHWPILFFMRELHYLGAPSGLAVAVVSTFGASWASYHFLEKRVVFQPQENRKKKLVATFVILTLPLLLVAGWHFGSGPYRTFLIGENLISSIPGDLGEDEFHRVVSQTFTECADEEMSDLAYLWGDFLRCQQTSGEFPVRIALVGDSHAEHLFYGLASARPEDEIAYYIQSDVPIFGASDQMTQILQHVENSNSIDTVVLSAFWIDRGVPRAELVEVIETFVLRGKSVFLTNDIPRLTWPPAACKSSKTLVDNRRECEFTPTELMELKTIDDVLKDVSETAGATFVDTYSVICPKKKCSMSGYLSPENPEVLLYRDMNHLNLLGSTLVGFELNEQMALENRG